MTSIIITLIIVLHKIPLINILGDKGVGYYSIALVIYLLLMSCISYGLPKAISSLITTYSSKGQYNLVYETTKNALLFATLSGLFAAVLVFLSADVIADNIMSAGDSAQILRGFAPCLIFISILGVLHGVYAGIRAVSISKAAHRIEELCVAILTVLGAYLYSATGASIGFTCGVFIAFVFSAILFLKFRKKLIRMARKDGTKVSIKKKEMLILIIKTMLPFVITLVIYHLSNLIDYAVFNRIMNVQGHKENSYIILLGMMNGKYEFFISLPLIIVNWFAASKVPVLSKIAKEGNKRKIHNKISQSIRYTSLAVIPCTAFYIIYAKPLMNLLFTGINDTPAMLLRIGAISMVFYSLAAISSATLNALEDWVSVSENAIISLIIQIISLLIMMIIFQWSIVAVVLSRIVFSASLFILNEHILRERTGYVMEQKRSFTLPFTATVIMSGISFVIYFVLELFIPDKIAVIIILFIAVPVYMIALVYTGGITQREMYRVPGGKYLAPLCKKLHLN